MSVPSLPSYLLHYSDSRTYENLEISDNLMISTDVDNICFFNISNTHEIEKLSEISDIAVNSIEFFYPHLYVAEAVTGLRVYDCSNPSNPTMVGGLNHSINGLDVAVDYDNGVTY
ncbi:MAG: hypothetical protein E4G98_02740 [Promethearchaeota archaeon]|nr:MAG: hypothetical protein E4G98_02740 [Candidatus Lokiarchaeota archaeon]